MKDSSLLDQIFRHTHEIVAVLDDNFNFVRVSHAYARACKRDICEFPGRSHFELSPFPLVEECKKVMETGIPYQSLSRALPGQDGEWCVSLARITDACGNLLLFMLKSISVPPEPASLRKARDLGCSLNALMAHAADEEDLLQGMCRAMVKQGGYLMASVVCGGKAVAQYGYPGESAGNIALPLGCCDTAYGTMNLHAETVLQEEEINWLNEVAIDLSYAIWAQRMRAGQRLVEEKLRESEERYRLILENAADAVMIVDPEGRFVYVNQQAQKMLGYSADELLGMSLSDITPPEEIETVTGLFEEVKSCGQVRAEIVKKRQDGGLFPVEVNAVRLPDGNYFGACRDISGRKKMEKEIQEHRRKMDSLQKNQVAAQTAAALAHELNQPLMAISSFSEVALMLLNAACPDIGLIRDAIENGKRQALKAGQSIHQLLHLLNMREIHAELIDLGQEIANVLYIAVTEHELRFHADLHIEPDLPFVLANRTHVQKVLLNLIHNGVEAMDAANVAHPEMKLTVRANRGAAFMTVQDKGPGFEPEDIRHLFEPFFSRKPGGIGMGLAISRSLIEANGGQLWIDPEAGPGATFHLTLPFAYE